MTRTPVQSSTVAAVGYAEGVLEVEFKRGIVYAYQNVPAEVHRELLAAPSKGRAFGQLVRGRFEYRRLD